MAFHHPSMEAVNFSKALSHYIRICHSLDFLVLMGHAGLYNHLHKALFQMPSTFTVVISPFTWTGLCRQVARKPESEYTYLQF